MSSPRAPSAVVPTSQPPKRNLYQCGICFQSYTRIDHLTRHIRSHTQEKPYQCTVCEKRFGRIDLLSRHATLHNTDGGEDSSKKRRRKGSNATSTTPRASQACGSCAENHLRCDDEKPCRRCVKRSMPCLVSQKPVGNINMITPTSVEHYGSADGSFPQSTSQSEPAHRLDSETDGQLRDQFTTSSYKPMDSQFWMQDQTHSTTGNEQQTSADMMPGLSHDYGGLLAPDSMDMFPDAFNLGSLSGTRTPRSLVTFGLETDLDLSAVDLSFLESYNTRNPFEFETLTPPLPQLDPAPGTLEVGKSNETRDSTSPHRLIWRFVPAPQDHGYCEHDNLLLPAQTASNQTPESLVDLDSRLPTERLDLSSRDKILSIAVSQLKHPISRAVSSFPSVELLDSLIQYYLTAPFSTASSWFHRASFNPKKLRPELLLAMAAAGAVLTPDPALRKLGFAMQEVVRHQLPILFEADNTLIRDLELHQAYLLGLEISIWSGNSRKMEIAESFSQPVLTMMRRGGMFHQSAYQTITVRPEDEGQVLEDKWMAWVKQESAKRLVYHIFQHDAQSSMALLTNPLISYAEVCLPLPATQRLWAATCAQEWKDLYCRDFAATSIPTLIECVANFDLLDSNRYIVDMNISCSAMLHAIWGMVWEYRRLSFLLGNNSRYWDNGLLMTSRYQELHKMLGYFCIGYHEESPICLNIILMHMHVSLEEIQALATLDDPARACETPQTSPLRDWSKRKESRQAVWHAGQVIRHVKLLRSQTLRDFTAVALYHASLTLWAYGLFSKGKDSVNNGHLSSPQSSRLDNNLASAAGIHERRNAWLDGAETDDVRRYISLERGVPTLHGIDPEIPTVSLEHPRAVLGLALELMEQNYRIDSSVKKPPLVTNLIHLIEKMRDTTRY